jgi:tetratricopeptide (TPR) repeat protein
MEVAVTTSLPSGSRFPIFGVLLLALVGCAGQEIVNRNDDLRRDGIEQFNQQNYADAAGSFRAAARSDPRDYRSLFYLGASYERMNQYHQAVEAYKSSLDAQPRTLAGAEDETGRLRTMDALASLVGRADTRDAELNLIEQRARTAQDPIDFFLLAKIYRYRGDADSAVDAYNRAALKDPKDFSLVKEYGLYLAQLRDQRAEKTLRKAYAMRSSDDEIATALRQLGVVPGPALKDEKDLVAPPVPKGPIPPVTEMRLPGFGGSGNDASAQPAGQTVEAPRD